MDKLDVVISGIAHTFQVWDIVGVDMKYYVVNSFYHDETGKEWFVKLICFKTLIGGKECIRDTQNDIVLHVSDFATLFHIGLIRSLGNYTNDNFMDFRFMRT